MKAVIVGAGIIGCALTRELARRGLGVEVIDRGAPGAGTTAHGVGNVLVSDKGTGTGTTVPDAMTIHHRRDMSRARLTAQHFSTRLTTAHSIPDGWQTWLEDTTVVCRCEATTLGQLRGTHSAEASARATRLNTRAGLGPCQARFCGANVDAICGERAADRAGASGPPAATPQNRAIAQPIRLGELAGHDGR